MTSNIGLESIIDPKRFRHELKISMLSLENAYLNLTGKKPNPNLSKSIYEDGIKKLKTLISLLDQKLLEQKPKEEPILSQK
ncbi:MAG: hypothetical protein HY072_02710 [Deltaproteobacteria bacterium]|nr:hypothetical protein [Deltaproteobacteria bacterium]